MTELEWLSCPDPALMVGSLKRRPSDRKMRLFAVACCRRVWDTLRDPAGRRAVEVAERFADGAAEARELRAAHVAAARATADYDRMAGVAQFRAEAAVTAALNATGKPASLVHAAECARDAVGDADGERAAQALLLRDLLGNPFRPPTLAPGWRTSTVVALAAGIYSEQAFDRLPILADALQDAGCDNDELLEHLRGDGAHVRGCWVLDLILGRE